MKKLNSFELNIEIPKGFIVFISGVPGVGKTTLSYELLKMFNEFRIIEETDLIREVLRGYNEFIKDEFRDKINFLFDKIEITDHTKLLSLNESKQQCEFMKKSLENIIARQQRKGIPSIINGVHIIPESLNGLAKNHNIIYINLFINSESELYNRLLNRDPKSYMLDYISLIYETNIDIKLSTAKLFDENTYIFNNIDVTSLTVNEALYKIIECIKKRIKSSC